MSPILLVATGLILQAVQRVGVIDAKDLIRGTGSRSSKWITRVGIVSLLYLPIASAGITLSAVLGIYYQSESAQTQRSLLRFFTFDLLIAVILVISGVSQTYYESSSATMREALEKQEQEKAYQARKNEQLRMFTDIVDKVVLAMRENSAPSRRHIRQVQRLRLFLRNQLGS